MLEAIIMAIGAVCFLLPILPLQARDWNRAQETGTDKNNGNKNGMTAQAKMTREAQEAKKAEIAGRLGLTHAVRPVHAPKSDDDDTPTRALGSTLEDIERYHDGLDRCGTPDCDISAAMSGKTVEEHCDVPGCDMEAATVQSHKKETGNNVYRSPEAGGQRLPLVYQLAVAEAVMHRRGRAGLRRFRR